MNKKTANSILFIICGTLVSILLFFVLAIALFALCYLICFIWLKSPDAFLIACMISVIAALFLGMLIYQKLVVWVITKFHLEDKLDPLFGKNKKKRITKQD